VAKLKYLETTVTKLIHEEIKSRLKEGNACCHPVQSLLLFRLLSIKVKIKTYKIVILPVVLYGRKTSSLTISEGHTLKIESV
jgi:hypothetical protein